jgi:hypothetical protein
MMQKLNDTAKILNSGNQHNKNTIKKATDYLVQCGNPESFDKTIQQLGSAVLIDGGTKGNYIQKDGYYVMRVFGEPDFLKFAIEAQGYGKIVKQLDDTI